MLFLLFIGACLSINHESLQPIKSQMPSSLVSIARTNPLALIKMLDGANPDAIRGIVKILDELITEIQENRNSLSAGINNANSEIEEIKVTVGELVKLEGSAEEVLDLKSAAESKAKGEHEAMEKVFETSSPPLKNEIDILTKVKDLLVDLQPNTDPNEDLEPTTAPNQLKPTSVPNQEDLLEVGSATKGQAYLKLLANAQADPDKLEKIIGFVQTLLNSVTKEHQKLVDQLEVLEQAHSDALDEKTQADVAHKQAIRNLEAGQGDLSVAKGKLEAAQKAWDLRSPNLQREEDVLNQVIDLLNTTADKE